MIVSYYSMFHSYCWKIEWVCCRRARSLHKKTPNVVVGTVGGRRCWRLETSNGVTCTVLNIVGERVLPKCNCQDLQAEHMNIRFKLIVFVTVMMDDDTIIDVGPATD